MGYVWDRFPIIKNPNCATGQSGFMSQQFLLNLVYFSFLGSPL